jgi:hypothetical protein
MHGREESDRLGSLGFFEAKNPLCFLCGGDYSGDMYGYCYEKHYAYDYGDASQSFFVDEQVCSSMV